MWFYNLYILLQIAVLLPSVMFMLIVVTRLATSVLVTTPTTGMEHTATVCVGLTFS
jgi:hypothetical protein